MKQIFIVIITAFIVTNMNAQVKKGAKLIGGSLSFNKEDIEFEFGNKPFDKYEKLSFSVRPQYGVFILESLLVGAGLDYKYSDTDFKYKYYSSQNSDYETMNGISINPFVTKFYKLSERLYFTTTLNLFMGYEFTEFESSDFETYSLKIDITPGITYFISGKHAIVASVGSVYYRSSTMTKSQDNSYSDDLHNDHNSFGIDLQLNNFMLGFQYYFNK